MNERAPVTLSSMRARNKTFNPFASGWEKCGFHSSNKKNDGGQCASVCMNFGAGETHLNWIYSQTHFGNWTKVLSRLSWTKFPNEIKLRCVQLTLILLWAINFRIAIAKNNNNGKKRVKQSIFQNNGATQLYFNRLSLAKFASIGWKTHQCKRQTATATTEWNKTKTRCRFVSTVLD